jgi:hypothetical protein
VTPDTPGTPADRGDGDAIDHLWTAAHEFLQAVRKLVDAADELVEQQRQRPRDVAPEPRVRHIDIDAS